MRRIHVVAAVIADAAGNILIAQRPLDKHQGGLWEFPGGKVEAGEAVEAALVRELEEELGIVATHFRPLINIAHDYADKQVLLDVWRVSAFAGEAHGRESQPVRWVAPAQLGQFAFPAANIPIVAAARLPDCWLITPDPDEEPDTLGWLAARIACGARLITLRAKSLGEADYLALAEKALALCRQHGVTLLVHGRPQLLQRIDADGVHCASTQMASWLERPLPAGKWLAVSAHSREELQRAMRLGADFAALSPVQATLSHPGAAGMGWAHFAELVAEVALPVYALGGLSHADLEQAWSAGAQGVAGIRGLFAPE